MARLKIPYLIAKGGRFYWQPSAALRAHWPARRLADDEAAAIAEARAINEAVAAWRKGRAGAREAATVAGLIADYRASRFYLEKTAKTRHGYDQNLAVIAGRLGDLPPAAVTKAAVNAWYEEMRSRTPAKANAVVTMLRILFDRAAILHPPGTPGHVADNPAARLSLVGRPPAGRIWPKPAIAAFVAAADAAGFRSIGTAVLVNEWLGQRQGDFLRLGHAQMREGVLYLTQSKRGRKVSLPVAMVPHLVARLEDERARQRLGRVAPTTLIANERTGRPWSEEAFGKAFRRVRRTCAGEEFLLEEGSAERVAMRELAFCHLRHTAVTRLFDAGVAREDIPAITGHSAKGVDGILETYRFTTLAQARRAFGQRLENER